METCTKLADMRRGVEEDEIAECRHGTGEIEREIKGTWGLKNRD